MYLIPIAWFAGSDAVSVTGLIANLIPVTAGNIVGGAGFVALVYWLVYIRKN
jgi:formate/nitrite transporter FocA (FNT family)